MSEAKKKLYFSGSIRGGRDDVEAYKLIIDILRSKYEVLTEHIGSSSLEKIEAGRTDQVIYERDVGFLDQADLVIAECTTPSLGVGYELAYAEKRGIPVTVLFDITKNHKLSAMVAGDSYFKKIYYSSRAELEQIVRSL
jgi:2'-deoxynucleoside 5'-phosphate N-hydrolase